MLVAAKAGRVVADQQISNCVAGEDAGSEGFDYSLRREGIEARGGVADCEPVVTCDWVEETRVGGAHADCATGVERFHRVRDILSLSKMCLPDVGVGEFELLGQVGVSYATHDAFAVRQACGVPPAVCKCFDQQA